MKVLVACEFSGVVRESFRKRGHDAWSCDILPADDCPYYHFQTDVRGILELGWDLLIAHPPCTYLSMSGVRWLYTQAGRWSLMEEAARFYRLLLDAPIPRIAVENPLMHRHAVKIVGRRADQWIHPWQFGHGERKLTGLHLRNLPKLTPTNIVSGREQRILNMPDSLARKKLRSITYAGIADAMAEQWGGLECNSLQRTA